MQRARVRALSPRVWNTTGSLYLTLAARHDANFNYVTVNVRKMIQEGLIPLTFEQFCDRFDQGDIFLIQLNGQVNVNAKINRANKTTMAFHCPRIVEMPVWNVDRSSVVEVAALMFGYTGLRLDKAPQPQRCSNTPAPLDPRLDTPAEHTQVLPKLVNVDLAGISQDRKMDFIMFVKNNMHLFTLTKNSVTC